MRGRMRGALLSANIIRYSTIVLTVIIRGYFAYNSLGELRILRLIHVRKVVRFYIII